MPLGGLAAKGAEVEDVRDKRRAKAGERARFPAALVHEDTPDYLRRIVTIAMHTGLRRGEIFKLRWPDVSLQRATPFG